MTKRYIVEHSRILTTRYEVVADDAATAEELWLENPQAFTLVSEDTDNDVVEVLS